MIPTKRHALTHRSSLRSAYLAGVCLLAALALLSVAQDAGARQEEGDSLPRFRIEGEFIITLDRVTETAGHDTGGNPAGEASDILRANTEDSDLFFSFDRALGADAAVGGVAIRLRMEDDTAQPRLFAYLTGTYFRLAYGRLRLHNKLVRFPTPRNEDLIVYTHILNGSPGLKRNSDHLYGDNVILDLHFHPTLWSLAAFYQGRSQNEGHPVDDAAVLDEDTKPNGVGFSLNYDVPGEDRAESFLRQLGIIYDVQYLKRLDGKHVEMTSGLFGAVMGWGEEAQGWDLGFQTIRSSGTGDATTATIEDNLTREKSVVAISYLRRVGDPEEVGGWQTALTYAQKDYPDISEGSQWSLIPTVIYRAAPEFDLLFQAIHTEYGRGLVPIVGRDSRLWLQVGIVLEFEAFLNGGAHQYDSILGMDTGEMLHGY